MYITHDRIRLCMKVSQSSWRKLSDLCVYYTVICSPEKHVASHVAVRAQNTHCTQPLVNMKCCSQHTKSIMYVIIEVTWIHVDVNSVYFWGKHNINWEKKLEWDFLSIGNWLDDKKCVTDLNKRLQYPSSYFSVCWQYPIACKALVTWRKGKLF